MPVNRSFDLAALMAPWPLPLASRQRVFFEYVMLEDVNDTADDARRLARLLRGLKAKVNLIPFNDWEGAKFRRPPLAGSSASSRSCSTPDHDHGPVEQGRGHRRRVRSAPGVAGAGERERERLS